MDDAEWKSSIQDIQEGSCPQKKKSVPYQFDTVKYRSETYSWTQKLNKWVLGNFVFVTDWDLKLAGWD